ncbi:hypothetical protein C0J52_23958 [Blattella germanica]|nr:hypothetical protein C0J52_23958 [Blattella germanica]
MEMGWTRGETSAREMGTRSYYVGSIYREERTRMAKTQMADMFIAGAGKQWSRQARDRKKWKELEKSYILDQK